MPEKEISFEEVLQVVLWLRTNGGDRMANIGGSDINAVYKIDGEPLVIYNVEERGRILCTEKQAQSLGRAGIQSFQEQLTS